MLANNRINTLKLLIIFTNQTITVITALNYATESFDNIQ